MFWRLQAYRNDKQCHVACDLGGTNITAPFGEDEEKLQLTPQRRSRRSRGSESPLRAFYFVGVSILFCRAFEGVWTVFGQRGLRELHKHRRDAVKGTGENYGTGHFIHILQALRLSRWGICKKKNVKN